APDVFAAVTGTGETGAALVDVVDFVQFTGSTATGRKIATAAANRLIGYSLELGGKDPMIVLADADLERAVNGAACCLLTRVIMAAPSLILCVTAMDRAWGCGQTDLYDADR
ncbi:MAG: aldehyde dehydrogenase family protein, partial [Marmoricola sp.]